MRLTDLDPHWIHGPWGASRCGLGVSFRCPHCGAVVLGLLFENPLDGGTPAPPQYDGFGGNGGRRWRRVGLDLSELTISPTIEVPGHWAGHVVRGDCR